MHDAIRDLQDQFAKTELRADVETLNRLLADDFLSIGPKGFSSGLLTCAAACNSMSARDPAGRPMRMAPSRRAPNFASFHQAMQTPGTSAALQPELRRLPVDWARPAETRTASTACTDILPS